MSFEKTLKIPLDRIGVVIGKNGETKSMIENACKVKLHINSEEGDVMIRCNTLEEGSEPFKALELVTAIARGFAPYRAKRLLEEDVVLLDIDLKLYAKSKNSLERIKARLIGTNGKTRRIIEELSGAYISIYGHYVSIIGRYDELKLAEEAINMLIKGCTHKTVYTMLENAKRRLKDERLKLWEENVE